MYKNNILLCSINNVTIPIPFRTGLLRFLVVCLIRDRTSYFEQDNNRFWLSPVVPSCIRNVLLLQIEHK